MRSTLKGTILGATVAGLLLAPQMAAATSVEEQIQAMQDRMAHARRKLEAGRLLAWRAAWLADHKKANAVEAAMAKAAGDQATNDLDALLRRAHALLIAPLAEAMSNIMKFHDLLTKHNEIS